MANDTATAPVKTQQQTKSKNVFYLLEFPKGTMLDYETAISFVETPDKKRLVPIYRELNKISRADWEIIIAHPTGKRILETQGAIFEVVAEGDNFVRDAVAIRNMSAEQVADRSLLHCFSQQHLEEAREYMKGLDLLGDSNAFNRAKDIGDRLEAMQGKGVQLPDITAEFPTQQQTTLRTRTYSDEY